MTAPAPLPAERYDSWTCSLPANQFTAVKEKPASELIRSRNYDWRCLMRRYVLWLNFYKAVKCIYIVHEKLKTTKRINHTKISYSNKKKLCGCQGWEKHILYRATYSSRIKQETTAKMIKFSGFIFYRCKYWTEQRCLISFQELLTIFLLISK